MKRTVVETTFPYPLKWGSGWLDVCVDNKVFEVYFERQYRQPSDPAVSGSGIVSAENLEVKRDRLGRAAHSFIHIRFPMYVEHDSVNPWSLLNWVHTVINRILQVYRYTTGEFHVDNFPKNELRDYKVKTLYPNGTFDSREPEVVPHWKVNVPQEPIPHEAQQFLRSGKELAIPRVLYLNAKREEFFENYRMAVVEAETAFEALVDQVVDNYYKSMNRSSKDIENILKQDIVNLLRDHIPQCCGGEQFKGTPEYCAWRNDLYKLRKGVVHDGEPVNAVQAEKALEAADKAMNWIETRAP